MPNDEELQIIVERAKTLDMKAFALLYERYFDRVYRYILARVGNHENAEDLAGQVFVKLIERIADFKWRGSGFTAWVFRIAHNLVLDWFRHQREWPSPALETAVVAGPEDTVLTNQSVREALSAMGYLKEKQRQVLLLRLVAGLSGRETAETLGLSEVNVRAIQHRALVALRAKLRVKTNA